MFGGQAPHSLRGSCMHLSVYLICILVCMYSAALPRDEVPAGKNMEGRIVKGP